VYEKPALSEIRAYVKEQLEHTVYEEEQRLYNPHEHYVDLSRKLYQVKEQMLDGNKNH
jgi:nicotinate phosphoribosyltransferase